MAFWKKNEDNVSRREVRSHTEIHKYSSTEIWINGKRVRADQVDPAMLREMAEKMGISVDELEGLFNQNRSGDLDAQPQRRRIRRVECVECKRTVVDRTGDCMYCGAVLPAEHEVAARDANPNRAEVNDVDAKFLGTDVETAESTEDDTDDDSFLQRLRQM